MSVTFADLPRDVQAICEAFLAGLRAALGANLAGFYLYGALTFPDSQDSIADIDFHAFVRRPLDDAARRAIYRLRERLKGRFGPLADELDGYVITLDDARNAEPPPHQLWPLSRVRRDEAWALHCAHVRAGHVIPLLGPDPRTLYPEPDWPHLSAALDGEMAFILAHLEDAPAYCVLNACRILYSVTTRDVVISKRAAGHWALGTLPEGDRLLVTAALDAYRGDVREEVGALLRAGAGPFVQRVRERITSRSRASAGSA